MSLLFLLCIFIASSLGFKIALLISCFKRNVGVILRAVRNMLIIVYIPSAIVLLSFGIWNKPVVTSEKMDEYPIQQLACLASAGDADYYYLLKEEKNISFVYVYDDKIHTVYTDAKYCRIHYGSHIPYTVEIYKFTEVYHNQWWFVRGVDNENVLYIYDIYIPSEKNILNARVR